ncbi:Transposase, Ptta/En/Spm, plant [Corchorus capsularis]|uniref:Transposase, Ptta/En/Spm, plant n=1 Tax=Corchorus capsularis TaxID=210143 RepID=A0A1R3JI85_COCAP|nr:Transposase, Ptta/En/Spm, plant [Corchorus capsularis]
MNVLRNVEEERGSTVNKKFVKKKAEGENLIFNFLLPTIGYMDKFNFSNDLKTPVMQQVQSQYKNRLHNFYQRYLQSKDCPTDVAEDDWKWLIENKWETRKFKEQSDKNRINRGKQVMKSICGTKSIVQYADKMKDKVTGEWLNATLVWGKTKQKPSGSWVVPNGEEIMNKLVDEGEKIKEKILSAPQPLMEHFGLVLEKKTGYARGLGVKGVTLKSREK